MVLYQSKYLYHYDQDKDLIMNQKTCNAVFGSPGYSYQRQYRPSGAAIRTSRFLQKDIVNQTILDLGCNEGEVLLACHQLGACEGFGVDYVEWCVQKGRDSARALGIESAYFMLGDLENQAIWKRLPAVDTVLLLAVLGTSTFANKFTVLANAERLAKKVLYYE